MDDSDSEYDLVEPEPEGVSEPEGGYETDGCTIPGSSKKLKLSGLKGAAVYQTKFKKAWTKTYPFIHEVGGDKYSFQCTICKRQVSCGHMGRHDVERHINKAMHQSNVKAAKSQATLRFQPVSSSLNEKI